MTTGKLYRLLRWLEAVEDKLKLQSTLETIASTLSNLTNSPAVPQYQSSLAASLAELETSAPKLRNLITPSQAADIKSMGGEEFFDPAISEMVKNTVQTNAMTPAVARDYVKELTSKRAGFLETIRTGIRNLDALNLEKTLLKAGSADIAFLIPREIFSNEVGPLAKELSFINRLIEHVSEAVTGEAQPAVLEQLSSSDPTVAVLAAVPVILAIGKVVDKFLETWKKVEEIRALRARLTEMGLKGKALEELTEQVDSSVDEVVEESTELVLANYSKDRARKAELANAIRTDTRRLFAQIERGLKVEIQVNKEDDEQAETDQEALEQLETVAGGLMFPEPAKHPMLLSSGELLEGDLVKVTHSKKTTTHKKTTSKKTAAQGDGADGETE